MQAVSLLFSPLLVLAGLEKEKASRLGGSTEGAHRAALHRPGLAEQKHILAEHKLQLAISGFA